MENNEIYFENPEIQDLSIFEKNDLRESNKMQISLSKKLWISLWEFSICHSELFRKMYKKQVDFQLSKNNKINYKEIEDYLEIYFTRHFFGWKIDKILED